MMESPEHAHEILERVARSLATGTDRLAERLRDAWIGGLHQLSPEGLPWPDLQEPLRDILDYFEADDRGGIIIEGLSEDEQRRIAGEMFDLYVEAKERISRADRNLPRK